MIGYRVDDMEMQLYHSSEVEEKFVHEIVGKALADTEEVQMCMYEPDRVLRSNGQVPIQMTDITIGGVNRKGYKLYLKYKENTNVKPHIVIQMGIQDQEQLTGEKIFYKLYQSTKHNYYIKENETIKILSKSDQQLLSPKQAPINIFVDWSNEKVQPQVNFVKTDEQQGQTTNGDRLSEQPQGEYAYTDGTDKTKYIKTD